MLREFTDGSGYRWIYIVDFAKEYGASKNTFYVRFHDAKLKSDPFVLPYFKKIYKGKKALLYIRADFDREYGKKRKAQNGKILENLYYKHIDNYRNENAFITALMGLAPRRFKASVINSKERNKHWQKNAQYFRCFTLKTFNRNRELISRILLNIEKIKLSPYCGSLIFNPKGGF